MNGRLPATCDALYWRGISCLASAGLAGFANLVRVVALRRESGSIRSASDLTFEQIYCEVKHHG